MSEGPEVRQRGQVTVLRLGQEIPQGFTPVRIDRRTMFGNPQAMIRRAEPVMERRRVIDAYRVHLTAQLTADTPLHRAVDALRERLARGESLALICHFICSFPRVSFMSNLYSKAS